MDNKTCDTILQKIIDMSNKKPKSKIRIPYNELSQKFGFSPEEVESALSKLQSQKLIETKIYRKPNEIYIFPQARAFGYFKEKQEIEQNERKNKWSERRWSLLTIIISAIISFILGTLSGFFIADYTYHLNNAPLPTASPAENTTIKPKITNNP